MRDLDERPPTRREERARLRRERDGSGPAREGAEPQRNPGASGRFALLGEVLWTGLLIAVVGIAVVTLPAALAAGIRHLRRCVAAEDSRMGLFWRDVRAGLVPGAAVGLGALVLTLVLLLDIDLARSGFLPGGPVIEVVGWVGLAVVAVVLLASAGAWTPDIGWRGALRTTAQVVRDDVAGAVYLLATAGFVVVVTWALIPLVIPALGCAALAVVAIPVRPRSAARRATSR